MVVVVTIAIAQPRVLEERSLLNLGFELTLRWYDESQPGSSPVLSLGTI
jgi:hypothetical protein